MNLTIAIPDEIGLVMLQRAAAAETDLATFVGQLVVEYALVNEPIAYSRMSVEEFIRRQEAWVKLHPQLDHAIDDSRESIYAGRE